jgi:pimeloyl-ACP methyl ester carboxylesterase
MSMKRTRNLMLILPLAVLAACSNPSTEAPAVSGRDDLAPAPTAAADQKAVAQLDAQRLQGNHWVLDSATDASGKRIDALFARADKPVTLDFIDGRVADAMEQAGVHPGTASRALNPETQGLVSDVTVRRVQQAAQALAYRPNPMARGLKTNEKLYQGMWGPGEIRATGSLKTYDGEPLLPRIAAPTLVITGEYDEMTADVLKPLVAKIPSARLVVVPDAGHGMPATHAEPYLAAVRAHLARNDG